MSHPIGDRYQAAPEDEGRRLDTVLAEKLGISRSRVASLLKSGQIVSALGRALKPSTLVKAGDGFPLPEIDKSPRDSNLKPENIRLAIVFEDEHLLVVDKPAGMVVHPAPGHYGGTLANALAAHLNAVLDPRLERLRPGIVHRLDKDTSGLLVVAKTFEAHENLALQIRSRTAGRTYLALSLGHWPESDGTIEAPIGRSRTNRKKMAVLERGGRAALTAYRVLESYPPAELVEARLQSGRTHQIRVHFAFRGHPVLGDTLYGGGSSAVRGLDPRVHRLVRRMLDLCQRQALHARSLSFRHPVTGAVLEFTSPLPEDFAAVLNLLRESSDQKESLNE